MFGRLLRQNRFFTDGARRYFSGRAFSEHRSFNDFRYSVKSEAGSFTTIGSNQAEFVRIGDVARFRSGSLVYCRLVTVDVFDSSGALQGRLFFHLEHPDNLPQLRESVDVALEHLDIDDPQFEVNSIFKGPSAAPVADPDSAFHKQQDDLVRDILGQRFGIDSVDASKEFTKWSQEANFGESGGYFSRYYNQMKARDLNSYFSMNQEGELYRVGMFKDPSVPIVE